MVKEAEVPTLQLKKTQNVDIFTFKLYTIFFFFLIKKLKILKRNYKQPFSG